MPLLLGVVMSPLAIMALVAVILSSRGRENGTAFLLGWAVGVLAVLALSFVVLDAPEVHERRVPPLWVPVVRTVLGVSLLVWAVLVLRHGRERVREMARSATSCARTDCSSCTKPPAESTALPVTAEFDAAAGPT